MQRNTKLYKYHRHQAQDHHPCHCKNCNLRNFPHLFLSLSRGECYELELEPVAFPSGLISDVMLNLSSSMPIALEFPSQIIIIKHKIFFLSTTHSYNLYHLRKFDQLCYITYISTLRLDCMEYIPNHLCKIVLTNLSSCHVLEVYS